MKRIIVIWVFLMAGLFISSGHSETFFDQLSYSAGASLNSRNIFRGIDIGGNNQFSLHPEGMAVMSNLGLALRLRVSFALWNRGGDWQAGDNDELWWTLRWRYRFFKSGWLETGAGFHIYNYPHAFFSGYAGTTFEAFARLAFPTILLQPELNITYDFLPQQQGFYWGMEIGHDFELFGRQLYLKLAAYRADNYMNQEEGNAFYYLFVQGSFDYFLNGLVPTDISISAAYPFELDSGWRVAPRFDFYVIPKWTWNPQAVEWNIGVSVERVWGEVPYELFFAR